ncbi:MAG: hypothetical protein JWP08_1000 [Bryobacterales bacterium]|nr:hypothetical protein [Bryobacterales bacterium]
MEQNAITSSSCEGEGVKSLPPRSEIEAQLACVLNSSQFRNAPVLQSLLRFITQRSLDSTRGELNEYVIASEVFGRSADFDSSVDTIVRTQAYRLRSKLTEYYRGEGAGDPIEIGIPKGHYVPSFHARTHEEIKARPVDTAHADPRIAEPAKSVIGRRPYVIPVLIAIVAGSCFLFGLLVGRKSTSTLEAKDRPSEVDSFWLNVLGSDRQPVVAFTNSVFLATNTGDLLRFVDGPVSSRGAEVGQDTAARGVANAAVLRQAGTTYYEDDMTGVGEVAGAVAIAQALSRIGARPVFKRSRLISASDLENHNVVFLGSPFVNQILNDLPIKSGFLFRTQGAIPSLWGGVIVNTHPRPNELAIYSIERTPGTQILRTDYGLISELPGLTSGRKLIVLAGLTTTGTQAAVEFATSVEGVREMAARLPDKRWPAAFDFLLRVKLNQGLDIIRSECVAARTRP